MHWQLPVNARGFADHSSRCAKRWKVKVVGLQIPEGNMPVRVSPVTSTVQTRQLWLERQENYQRRRQWHIIACSGEDSTIAQAWSVFSRAASATLMTAKFASPSRGPYHERHQLITPLIKRRRLRARGGQVLSHRLTNFCMP